MNWRGRRISSPSAPTTSSSTCSAWTGRTIRWPMPTVPSTPRSCGPSSALPTPPAEPARRSSVCGEMAADADLMPFLIGIGIHALSVDPHHLPELQQRINALTFAEAKAYADAAPCRSHPGGHAGGHPQRCAPRGKTDGRTRFRGKGGPDHGSYEDESEA